MKIRQPGNGRYMADWKQFGTYRFLGLTEAEPPPPLLDDKDYIRLVEALIKTQHLQSKQDQAKKIIEMMKVTK